MASWRDRCDEAIDLLLTGGAPAAEELFRQLRSEALPDSREQSRATEGLAMALAMSWKNREALAYFQEAAAAHVARSQPPSEPSFHTVWATCLLEEGDLPGAATRLDEAMALYGQDLASLPWRVEALRVRVTVHMRQGDEAGAAGVVQQLVELFEAEASRGPARETLELAATAAEAAAEAGCATTAELLGVRALAMARSVSHRDPEAALEVLEALGALYSALDQHQAALDFLDEALALRSERHGAEARSTLRARADRALALIPLDLAGAIQELSEVIAVGEATLAPEDDLLLTQLGNLGGMWLEAGSPAAALPYLERAAALADRSEAPITAVTNAYGTLASCLVELEHFARARAITDRAEAIVLERLGPGHPELANVYHNRAALLLREDRLDEAEALFMEALELATGRLPPDDPGHGHLLEGLLMLYHCRGDRPRFEEMRRRRLELAFALGGEAAVRELTERLPAELD